MTGDPDFIGGGRFGMVPADVLEGKVLGGNGKPLSLHARWLFAEFCARAGEDGRRLHCSIAALAGREKVARRALQNWLGDLVEAGLVIRREVAGKTNEFEIVRDPKKRIREPRGANQGSQVVRTGIRRSEDTGANQGSHQEQEEQMIFEKKGRPRENPNARAGPKGRSARHKAEALDEDETQGHLRWPPHGLPGGGTGKSEINWNTWADWLSQVLGGSLEQAWNFILESTERIAQDLGVPGEEANRLLDGCLKKSRVTGTAPAQAVEDVIERKRRGGRGKKTGGSRAIF